VTEAELQACVIDLAHVYGWKVAHFRPAQTSKGWRTPVGADGKGFPDLVMAKLNHLIIVELKSDRGKLTDAQQEWIYALDATVWTPADWKSGLIQKILSNNRNVIGGYGA
jgi:hypothetical protein